MSTVIVKLSPSGEWHNVYDVPEIAEFRKDSYVVCESFQSDKEGVEAAEDAFDLTNNPARCEEAKLVYNHRSVSVGDIVEVDGIEYACDRIGWSVIS